MSDKTERQTRIERLEKLWLEKMKGKTLADLDSAVNRRFEVSGGRDSLDYYAMSIMEEGLNKVSPAGLWGEFI